MSETQRPPDKEGEAKTVEVPPPPSRTDGPDSDWTQRHPGLYADVKKALKALPLYFKSNTNVSGIGATDVFAYNTALGTEIEVAVVATLNNMRSIWDPSGRYATYHFRRQSQAFPDVRLESVDKNDETVEQILMGIEVKGWFALAKEGEPSFRFKATPNACAPQDLLLVVPWYFSNVISGSPVLMSPLVEEARYAALMRNYYWTWLRPKDEAKGAKESLVTLAEHQTPYPAKSDLCSDKPVYDSGGNFGRARSGFADEFFKQTLEEEAAGIPLKHWIRFLKVFTDSADEASVTSEMEKLVKSVSKTLGVKQDSLRAFVPFFDALLKAAQK